MHAAKLNSLPKLEFAIPKSRTNPFSPPPPHRAANSLICLLLLLQLPFSSSVLYIAYLRYRSQIQSRDSRADVSYARGIPQSSGPEVRSGFASGSGLPEIPRGETLLSFSLTLFTFFYFFLLFLCRSPRTCGETEADWRRSAAPAGGWRGCINIMQISGAACVRVCARARETVTFHLSCTVPQRSAKCRCLFPPRYARLACLPYRPEIAGTLHTQHNSTPNLLLRHSPLLPLPPCPFYLPVSPYRTLSHPSPPLCRSVWATMLLLTSLSHRVAPL